MITPNWYPDKKVLRQFAVIAVFGFGLVGFMVWRLTGSAAATVSVWALGALVTLVGVPFPNAIRPVYVAITAVALPIGWLISQILLRVLYYGVMTPFALCFRLIGRDALSLKRPETDSYWREHAPRSDASSYLRQT